MAQDAKRASAAASQVLKDDFQAVAEAVAEASDKIGGKVRGSGEEQFKQAEEAAKQAEREDRKFVMDGNTENPFNKAAKMAHDSKESFTGGQKREPASQGMNKETEELQKKGAERKAEEDSFNLM